MWGLNLPWAAAKANMAILLVATAVQSESILHSDGAKCEHAGE